MNSLTRQDRRRRAARAAEELRIRRDTKAHFLRTALLPVFLDQPDDDGAHRRLLEGIEDVRQAALDHEAAAGALALLR